MQRFQIEIFKEYCVRNIVGQRDMGLVSNYLMYRVFGSCRSRSRLLRQMKTINRDVRVRDEEWEGKNMSDEEKQR